jgi:transposase InsO family protein
MLVKRRITSQDVIDQLFQLIIFRGIPEHFRSDNGSEFTAKAVRRLVKPAGYKNAIHRTGESLGEWVY